MKVGSILADINRMEQIIKAFNKATDESAKDNNTSINLYDPCSIAANDARDAMMYLRKYINALKDIDISEE